VIEQVVDCVWEGLRGLSDELNDDGDQLGVDPRQREDVEDRITVPYGVVAGNRRRESARDGREKVEELVATDVLEDCRVN
jgi:hypothetical protein